MRDRAQDRALPVVPLAAIPYRTFPSIPLGPVELHTFGLLVAAGILAGTVVAGRMVAAAGGDRDRFESLAVRAVLVGLVGARLTWVVTHPGQIATPLDVVAVWEGGLQFSGGFLLAVVVIGPTLRRWGREARWRVADAAAAGLTVGLVIGRIGCVAVGEHLGGRTGFPLAVRYLGGPTVEGPLTVGVAYHNTAVYEALHLAVLAGLLAWAHRSGRLRVGDGRTAAVFLLWYGVLRFVTDTARAYDERLLALTGAQWVALVVLVPAGLWLWRRSRDRREPVPDADGPGSRAGAADGGGAVSR